MTRLRILAGSSFTNLAPVEPNSDVPLHIKSRSFDGQVAVYIKDSQGDSGPYGHSSYFDHERRQGITWSIQVQGRFLHTYSADDILFGNVFDRPLKLPWGFGAVQRFMRYVDPTLEENLSSKKQPWALSPLIATMPHIHLSTPHDSHRPSFPASLSPIVDDVTAIRTTSGKAIQHDIPPKHRKQRKAHFKSTARRRDVVIGPEDLITADFCHHYLEFGEDSIVLRLPCGIAIDLLRYWDGQPVRFVCCERAKPGGHKPWGKIFFCVVVERREENDRSAEKATDIHIA